MLFCWFYSVSQDFLIYCFSTFSTLQIPGVFPSRKVIRGRWFLKLIDSRKHNIVLYKQENYFHGAISNVKAVLQSMVSIKWMRRQVIDSLINVSNFRILAILKYIIVYENQRRQDYLCKIFKAIIFLATYLL